MSVKRDGSDVGKEVVGERVVELVESGMVVGFGTGSTVGVFLRELAGRDVDVVGVCTSFDTELLARRLGFDVRSLSSVGSVDLAVDGADQVDFDGNLIKGGGAAHFREKVVASFSDRFVCIVDDTKVDSELDLPVPIEVAPFALENVLGEIGCLGGEGVLRSCGEKDGPLVTDNGNFVVDTDFGRIQKPERLSKEISCITGVVEHGLFPGMADSVLVGSSDGVRELREIKGNEER
ncbi:Ribose 5-phosphate isomerase RpiA [Methanonatronarchaeum thermophilum]|uniref:Ribose-5-phosphate isomerase A n=1 Tax=Methanonatronarchaeum thermophilum TaxID=1927129 RepID=A0A1Y3GCS0_9EURY|nr:ribose-5-phosphate isomerase RpiA [Methanonatronarchaeum thermophilum]OUJ18113.1 Ribose 5-phosphate isomerase RpiA [Methanonatronarchaeum thermophilum]